MQAEDLNIPKARLFKARTYMSVAIIKDDYLTAKHLCSIDIHLVEQFASAFIKKNEKEVLADSLQIWSNGWEILVEALRATTSKQYRPALKALKVILSMKVDKKQSRLTVHGIRPLHDLLVETDLHAYAAMVGQQGDSEGMVDVLIGGVHYNSRIQTSSGIASQAHTPKDLILLKQNQIGHVSYCNLDAQTSTFSKER